ncbi:hypothetical protein ACWKT3_20000 [Streptomyces violaceus]
MSGTGRRRAPEGAGKVRLTWRGRILMWSAGVCSALLLGGAGVGAWLHQDLNDNIQAADLDNKLGGNRPVNLSPGSKNILVVGSDSRDGDNAKYRRTGGGSWIAPCRC